MNKKAILFTFILAVVTVGGFVGTINLGTYLQNKRTIEFSGSPRYEFMQEKAMNVAEKFCGGKHEWSQMGYNRDNEHVGIICDDKTEVEIRIKSDLSDKREDE